jgi:hypothetical protein
MKARWGSLGGALLMLGFLSPAAWANGENVVVGQVEAVNPQRNLLVVSEVRTANTVRLTVDSGTEVKRCRKGLSLSEVRAAQTVRVKYLEKAAGGLDALSILILPGAVNKPGAEKPPGR